MFYLGFVTYPPVTQYYSHDLFAVIQEKLTTRSVETSFVIVGDMNTRFGKSVTDILTLLEPTNVEDLSYPCIPDDVQTPSDNAELLSTICIDNTLLVVTCSCCVCWRKYFQQRKSNPTLVSLL